MIYVYEEIYVYVANNLIFFDLEKNKISLRLQLEEFCISVQEKKDKLYKGYFSQD